MFTFLSRALPALLILFSVSARAADSYNHIYVFGDSLSDTGNLASVTGAFPPPYYMNRVSNGPVAVEILADKLGLDAEASLHLIGPATGSNYAVAGARAHGSAAIDLDTQLTLFLANHGGQAPADALYLLFVGGNDLRDARDAGDIGSSLQTVDDAVDAIEQAMQTLAGTGARHFLVINAPNIAMIPETRLLAVALDQPWLTRRADGFSRLYRRQLHKTVKHLEHDAGIEVAEFDLFRFFNHLVRNAQHYGFSNSTDACFSSNDFSFHPDCNFGANFDQFVFFDEIHPTARVHAIVGEAFYQALELEAVKQSSRHYSW